MELSDFAIIKLVPFVTGDNNLSRQRKGPELVELFCSCGYRDIYDFNNGGLPKLSKDSYRNPSRSEYTKDRLLKLNGTDYLRTILKEVFVFLFTFQIILII